MSCDRVAAFNWQWLTKGHVVVRSVRPAASDLYNEIIQLLKQPGDLLFNQIQVGEITSLQLFVAIDIFKKSIIEAVC